MLFGRRSKDTLAAGTISATPTTPEIPGTPSGEQKPGETPAPAPGAQPTFVTMEQFNTFQTTLMSQIQQLSGVAAPGTGTRPQAVAPVAPTLPAIEDVTDEQYNTAVENGGAGAAAIISKRHKADQERLRREMLATTGQIQEMGVNAIGSLMRQQLSNLPYYDILKPDIDAALAQMGPTGAINPDAQRLAYDIAVGRNLAKIQQLDREKILREHTANVSTGDTNASGAFRSAHDEAVHKKLPTPEDVWGKEGIAALSYKGLTVEAEIARRGYASWEAYCKDHEAYLH